jgi:hypothetical protein
LIPKALIELLLFSLDLFARRAALACVLEADVANDVARMPARKDVIADRCNASVRKGFGADFQDSAPRLRWGPAEYAVTNDVVENLVELSDVVAVNPLTLPVNVAPLNKA